MRRLSVPDFYRPSRLLDYWDFLNATEKEAEKQRYQEESYSAVKTWEEFYKKCLDLSCRGREPRESFKKGSRFEKAYWNLYQRVNAALVEPKHPRHHKWQWLYHGVTGIQSSSSRQSAPQSPVPAAQAPTPCWNRQQASEPVFHASAPRRNSGQNDPPSYASLEPSHAADHPSPYEQPREESRPKEQPQCVQPSGWSRFLGSIPALCPGGYFLPPFPDTVARDEPRASQDRQNGSNQRSRSSAHPICQVSDPVSPTCQTDRARFQL